MNSIHFYYIDFSKQHKMMKVISTYRIFIFFFVIFFISNSIFSQENFPINGVEDNRENHYAFVETRTY